MRYRIRLLVFFMGTAVFSNLVLFGLLFVHSHNALFREIQSKAISVVAAGAVLLDGDLVATVKTRSDEGSDAYRTLEQQLRKIRDANRRDDVQVKYIYTMMASPGEPGVFLFGIDAEESLKDKSHVGDVYKGSFGTKFGMADRYLVDDHVTVDQWGEWLCAYAPIKDSTGRVVAMLGADLAYSDVRRKTTSEMMFWGFVSLSVSIAIAALLSMLLSTQVSRPLRQLSKVLAAIGGGDYEARAEIKSRDEFGEVGHTVNQMVEGLKQRDVLKGAFAKYVSSQVLANILEDGRHLKINGERRKVTVLFSDIRNFTTLTETMAPEDVVGLLNDYFERMVEIVFSNHGTIDKFMGDGVMALFGAPQEDNHQEEHAIRAALAMRKALEELCQKWEAAGRNRINIGIGINTGTAVVGNVGSQQHMEYTAIGDTVNLASRLESMTKELEAEILISEYTYVSVRNLFDLKPMGTVKVKGRIDALSLFEVLAERSPQ